MEPRELVTVVPDEVADVDGLRKKVNAAGLRLDRRRDELLQKFRRQIRHQVHRPVPLDATLDLEPLPVKENVRLIAALELKPPADGIINLAVGDDLLDL